MPEEPRTWTDEDVPSPPYFHGTRTRYEVGDLLHTSPVDPNPGMEDLRERCFATVSPEEAFGWGVRRERRRGSLVYVYEVELVDPEVDVNVHGVSGFGAVTSVMSSQGRVVACVRQTAVADGDTAEDHLRPLD